MPTKKKDANEEEGALNGIPLMMFWNLILVG